MGAVRRGRRRAGAFALSAVIAGGVALLAGTVLAGNPRPLPAPASMPAPELRQLSDYQIALLRLFSETALGSELDGEMRRGRVVKWEQPIRAIIISGSPSQTDVAFLRSHLKILQKLTNLPITLVEDDSGGLPNLIIRFRPKIEVQSVVADTFHANGVCYVMVHHDTLFRIQHAEVTIADDDTPNRSHCIIEETTQALGLLNDSSVFGESIFNDRASPKKLQSPDAYMVRTLYDPRIQAGMGTDEVLPIAEALIRQLTAR